MKRLALAAAFLTMTLPATAEDRVRYMAAAGLPATIPALKLSNCNLEAAKRLAGRKGLELVGRTIEGEAEEALAACGAEEAALAATVPAAEMVAIRIALRRANARTISEIRNPAPVVCAGNIPAAMCFRSWRP